MGIFFLRVSLAPFLFFFFFSSRADGLKTSQNNIHNAARSRTYSSTSSVRPPAPPLRQRSPSMQSLVRFNFSDARTLFGCNSSHRRAVNSSQSRGPIRRRPTMTDRRETCVINPGPSASWKTRRHFTLVQIVFFFFSHFESDQMSRRVFFQSKKKRKSSQIKGSSPRWKTYRWSDILGDILHFLVLNARSHRCGPLF